MEYSEKVIEHYTNPRNVGKIDDASGIGEVGNPVCGDIMKMYIKVENNIITDVKFKTFSVEEISKVDHLYEKSDWVKKNVGVYSVSDPVAHLLSEGRVIINKQKYDGITFSIGRIDI